MTSQATKALAEIAATATRGQLPRIFVRSVAVNHDAFEKISLDCHTGDGSLSLKDAIQIPDQLQDIVNNNHLSSVVVSWPVQDNKTMKHISRRIMNNLDSSFSGTSHETLTTTRPFYMLDGSGRRLASMCIVKGGQGQSALEEPLPNNAQAPGTWLRQYSSSLNRSSSMRQ